MELMIRWLIRVDMKAILDIERHSFEFAWTEEDFLCELRKRNVIGMVAELGREVVGFMLYELHKDNLHILNFAVRASCRRQYIGKRMIQRLVDKLSQQRRKYLFADVALGSLGALKFFCSQGFTPYKLLPDYFEGDDCVCLRYSPEDSEAFWMSPYSTRISL